jgi:hypothetical protein
MRDHFKSLIGQKWSLLRAEKEHSDNYGLNESKTMAIQQVRNDLESELEWVLDPAFDGSPERITVAMGMLVLFNSVYR